MPINTQDDLKEQVSAKKSSGHKSIFYRITLYALSMICIALLTFTAAALVSGGPNHLINTVRNIFTSDTPKLIVKVGGKERKIKPMPNDQTKDLLALLNQPSSSPMALAILEANQDKQIKAILNKLSYKPKQFNAQDAPDQAVSFSKQPSKIKLFVHFKGKDLLFDSLEDLKEFNPGNDGPCYVLIEAYWPADKTWKTNRRGVYFFVINYDRPAQFELNAEAFDPGDLMVIYAKYLTGDDKISIQSDLPLSLNFIPYDDQTMIALAPLNFGIPAGQYDTTLTTGEHQHKFSVTIRDKDFPSKVLANEDGVIDIRRNANSKSQYDNIIQPILEEKEASLLWSGSGLMPIEEGSISTVYGTRYYIGDETTTSIRHSGIDIPARPGSQVRAVNNGKVMYVGEFADTGVLVIIEHGLGLKSWYFHLSESLVSVGDMVSKGDLIGKIGEITSGQESHLHLNLSVNDIYINPEIALHAPLFLK